MIALNSIRTDGGTQPRVALDWKVIGDYQDRYEDGVKFPPITVYHDGSDYWLADGFHRLNAARAAGEDKILADIRTGTLADALWFSFGANKAHGLRRSNEDKQRAIKAALRHPACTGLSDREIGRHVGVDHKTVAGWREKLTGEIPQSKLRTGKDGRTINSENIGKKALAGESIIEQAVATDKAGRAMHESGFLYEPGLAAETIRGELRGLAETRAKLINHRDEIEAKFVTAIAEKNEKLLPHLRRLLTEVDNALKLIDLFIPKADVLVSAKGRR